MSAVFVEAELEADAAYDGINDMDFEIEGVVRKPCAAGGAVKAVNGESAGKELPDAEREGVFFSVQCKGQDAAVVRKGQLQTGKSGRVSGGMEGFARYQIRNGRRSASLYRIDL